MSASPEESSGPDATTVKPPPLVRAFSSGPVRFFSPVASIVAGCLKRHVNRPEHLRNGCVFILPGIEGTAWQARGMVMGLRSAGVHRAMEIISWGTHPFGQLYNLCAIKANKARASRIAERIADYASNYPDAPITLIGYSGGGGMAVLTAEALGDRRILDRVILISAAVSPRYDLVNVLSPTRNGIVNFYSEKDWLILGLGTTVFGTIDRKKTPSAGRIGFRDAGGNLRSCDGLTQVGWRNEWSELGHIGGHIGWLSSTWAREILAPRIDPALEA